MKAPLTRIALIGFCMYSPLTIAQHKCVIAGKTVIQAEPCASTNAPGRYRCLVNGEVVYQAESCVKPKVSDSPFKRTPQETPDVSLELPPPHVQSSAATPSQPKRKDSWNDPALIAANQERIKRRLKDPDSAKFSGVFVSTRADVTVVCGWVNARNGLGGYSGPQRFISAGAYQFMESDMAAGEMSNAWSRMCN